VRSPRHPLLIVLAVIAAIEAVGLIGYAVYDVVQGLTVGITGPSEVSNLPALIVQIVIFAALGIGLLLVTRGWWRAAYGARAPFIVAQLLALVVGVPLFSAPDAGTRQIAVALIGLGVLGIVLALVPSVTRVLTKEAESGS
jgi:hypothetical protein